MMDDPRILAFAGPVAAFLSSVTWAVGSSGYAKLSQRYTPFAVNFNRAIVGITLFGLAAVVTGLTTTSQRDAFRLQISIPIPKASRRLRELGVSSTFAWDFDRT
ncbi:hypothetical protein EBZ37_15205, partial [bacterium]|nr:hypothetical protein [bacterium]